jgi:hypothetical protein
VFTDVVTTLSVSGGTFTYEPCEGDFAPYDGVIDGRDLAYLLAHPGILDPDLFADNFGLADCYVL